MPAYKTIQIHDRVYMDIMTEEDGTEWAILYKKSVRDGADNINEVILTNDEIKKFFDDSEEISNASNNENEFNQRINKYISYYFKQGK